jgi:transmembrane sensor
MTVHDERVRGLITQQAADWFIANRAGPTARERELFAEWLKASPIHVEEYLALSVIARDLREACAAHPHSADELLARARVEERGSVEPFWPRLIAAVRELTSSRWQTAALTMAAFAVVSLGLLLLWRLAPVPGAAAPEEITVLQFETRHGEHQTHRLADNSVLHLNTDTSVTVRYGQKARLVELTSGEADFEVVHEPERPFRVFAGSAEVVDLGTRFDVRLNPESTVVTVVEGRVAVGLSPTSAGGGANPGPGRTAPAPTVELGANQQVTVAEGEWPAAPVAVDAQGSTAWLHRQISFDHEPLERVAREFNRYSRKPIEITTPALRKLEISGVFSTDDTDAFIAFLRSLEGVHVEVTATAIRVSQD